MKGFKKITKKTINYLLLSDLCWIISKTVVKPGLRIICYHGTKERYIDNFKNHIRWFVQHYHCLTWTEFVAWIEGKLFLHKPAIFLTFDDGLESNYKVAAPVIESFGLTAAFFVIPGFIISRMNGIEREFYLKNIVSNPKEDITVEDYTPMNSNQVRDLSKRGHCIGCHTFSHAYFPGISSSFLKREIYDSAKILEEWTSDKVTAFAIPFAWNNITEEAALHIMSAYRYIFLPCPGMVRRSTFPVLLSRNCVDASWSIPELRFAISGLTDFYWLKRKKLLKSYFNYRLKYK